ncbi:MAG: hypothetical protein AAF433_01745 [Bacteroidota bacterium]
MTLSRLRLGLGVFLLLSLIYFGRTEVNILYGGDTQGYYLYLPATFIYGDLHDIDTSYLARFDHISEQPSYPAPGGVLTEAPNGHRTIKYTSGVALLQLPFFWAAHGLATVLPNVAADGYSWPYRWLINLSVIFYFLLAIGWLWRALSEHYRPLIVGSAILLLAVGSNLYNFLVFRGPMSHGYLFALYASLIWATVRFYRRPANRTATIIGISAGLITLIRPVEGICLLIPFLYGLTSRQALKERANFWKEHWPYLLKAGAVFVAVGCIQLLYWRYSSDHWLFFSYGEEQFFWDKSKIYAGLFSFRNGWLVYSPLLFLALAGIPLLWRQRQWWWPVITLLPLHIYIAYAWWNWYYINGFGSRPMVEIYALLVFPLAAFLQWSDRKKLLSYATIGLVSFFVGLNLFQHEQHQRGILWTESANTPYYWEVFGQLEHSERSMYAFFSDTRPAKAREMIDGEVVFTEDFETYSSDSLEQNEIVASGDMAQRIPPQGFYNLPTFEAEFLRTHSILEIRAKIYKKQIETPYYSAASLISQGSWPKSWRALRLDPLIGNENYTIWHGGTPNVWEEISYTIQWPASIKEGAELKIYFSTNSQPLFIDDVEIVAY